MLLSGVLMGLLSDDLSCVWSASSKHAFTCTAPLASSLRVLNPAHKDHSHCLSQLTSDYSPRVSMGETPDRGGNMGGHGGRASH